MNLQCNAARVIIRPDPEHQTSQVIIPDKYRKASDRGTVIAVGPGRRHIDGTIYPLQTRVGDRVVFSLLRSFRFDFNGEKLYVADEEEILAYLNGDGGAEKN